MIGYSGFGFQQGLFNVMFTIVPVLMVAILIAGLVRTISQWSKDEKSPRLTVDARVVSRRTAHRRTMSNKHHMGRDYTNYYVTFQFDSGDRLELELQGHEYGMIAEGDNGKLTFQGSRFLGFERTR